MTDTPKKPGRPRKTAPKPADLPSAGSKQPGGTQVPDEPEIATQGFHAMLARHMIRDHRMTWGEARISLGYGIAKQDPQQDQLWDAVYRMAQA